MQKNRFIVTLFLVILSGFITLGLDKVAYAVPSVDNPFLWMDNARDESNKVAKEKLSKRIYSRDTLAINERKIKEKDILATPGKRYIVKFNEDVAMQQIFDMVNSCHYKLLGNSGQRTFMINIKDMAEFEKRGSGLIEFIEEDHTVKLQAIPSDPYYGDQWALPVINMPQAWDINQGSNSIYVAVIDSGISIYHPDLSGADIRQGWDYIMGTICEWDATGHGTNVTGIIAAQTNNAQGIAGVNWNVAVIPLAVVYNDGTIYTSDVIAAVYDAADMGCDVINLSLGGPDYSIADYNAFQYAVSKGCTIVASAGNDGTATYNYPASYDGVISVGSVDSNLSRSYFSQYNDKLDVTAPGSSICTTGDSYYDGSDYVFGSGTSFSAPHIAGIAALASACDTSLTPTEFENLLKSTSTDLGAAGYDNYYGYGLVNAGKLLAPDLIIQNCTGPNSGGPGETISISETIKNQGISAVSNPFNVKYYLSSDTTIDTTTDTCLGQRSVAGGLVAGADNTAVTEFVVPTTVVGGTYYLGAIADGTGAIIESNETNNYGYDPVPIMITVSADATLKSLVPNWGSLSPAFASGTVTYALALENSITSISLTPTANESHASIKIDGFSVASGSPSQAINLTAGNAKEIPVVVTAQDGSSNLTYTVSATRALPQQAAPVFSPAAGAIAFGTGVTITSLGADSIYYTTDGTDPGTGIGGSTRLYTGPITINEATTINAIATKAGTVDSEIGSASYTIAGYTVSGQVLVEGDDLTEGQIHYSGGVSIELKQGEEIKYSTVSSKAEDLTENGSFSITGIASGDYTVVISKAGYLTRNFNLTINSDLTLATTSDQYHNRVYLWAGDIVSDEYNVIAASDVNYILSKFNTNSTQAGFDSQADIVKDQYTVVSAADVNLMLSNFNKNSTQYPADINYNDMTP